MKKGEKVPRSVLGMIKKAVKDMEGVDCWEMQVTVDHGIVDIVVCDMEEPYCPSCGQPT